MTTEQLETQMDRFVDEIMKRGKMTFPEAASILGISEGQVEEWANLLSKHKNETHIEIQYPRMGDPIIVSTIEKKKEEINEKVADLKNQKKGTKLTEEKTEVPKKLEEGEALFEDETEDTRTIKDKVSEIKLAEEKLSKAVEEGAELAKKTAKEPLPEKQDLIHLVKELTDKVKLMEGLEKEFIGIKKECEAVESALKKTEQEEKELIEKTDHARITLVETKNHLNSLVGSLLQKLSQAKDVTSHLDELKKLKKSSPESINAIEFELKKLEKELKDIEKKAKTVDKAQVKMNSKKRWGRKK
ncbi:MAG: hypothetical protein ABIG20_03325 [archaeon]